MSPSRQENTLTITAESPIKFIEDTNAITDTQIHIIGSNNLEFILIEITLAGFEYMGRGSGVLNFTPLGAQINIGDASLTIAKLYLPSNSLHPLCLHSQRYYATLISIWIIKNHLNS